MTSAALALLDPRLWIISSVGSLCIAIPAVLVCLRALALYHRVKKRVNLVIQSYTYLLLSDLVLGLLYVSSSAHDLVVQDVGRGLNPWWCKARAFVFVTAWVSQAVSLLSMSLMLRKLVAQQPGSGRRRQLPLLGSALGWGLGLVVGGAALGLGQLGNTWGLMCFCHERGQHMLSRVVLPGISGCLVFVCFNYIYACWRLRSVWQRSASVRSSLVSPLPLNLEGAPQSPASPGVGAYEESGGMGPKDEEKGNGLLHAGGGLQMTLGSPRHLLQGPSSTWGNLTQEGPIYAARAAVIVVRHGLVVVLIFMLSYGSMLVGMLWLSVRLPGHPVNLPVPLVLFTLWALKLQPLLNGFSVLRMLKRVHKRFVTITPLVPRLVEAIGLPTRLETETTATTVASVADPAGGAGVDPGTLRLLRALSSKSIIEEGGEPAPAPTQAPTPSSKPPSFVKPLPRLASPSGPSTSEGRGDGGVYQMGPHPIHVIHPSSASTRLEGLMADLYRRLASTLRASDVFMSQSQSNASSQTACAAGGGGGRGGAVVRGLLSRPLVFLLPAAQPRVFRVRRTAEQRQRGCPQEPTRLLQPLAVSVRVLHCGPACGHFDQRLSARGRGGAAGARAAPHAVARLGRELQQ